MTLFALAALFVLLDAQFIAVIAGAGLRRRDHGAVPVRDHAAQPRAAVVHSDIKGGVWQVVVATFARPASSAFSFSSSRAPVSGRAMRCRPGARGGRCSARTARRRHRRVRCSAQYLVPFEITIVLLLVAIVGAVVLAKRKL